MGNESSRDEADYAVRRGPDTLSTISRGQIAAYVAIVVMALVAVWVFTKISASANQLRELEGRVSGIEHRVERVQQLEQIVAEQAKTILELQSRVRDVESRLPGRRKPVAPVAQKKQGISKKQ